MHDWIVWHSSLVDSFVNVSDVTRNISQGQRRRLLFLIFRSPLKHFHLLSATRGFNSHASYSYKQLRSIGTSLSISPQEFPLILTGLDLLCGRGEMRYRFFFFKNESNHPSYRRTSTSKQYPVTFFTVNRMRAAIMPPFMVRENNKFGYKGL